VQEIVGATGRSFAHERPVISSASASNIRRPTSIMHRGMLFSRCSATDSSLRGLARRGSFPLVRRATLMGFTSTLRRLAPASGERTFLLARAHVPIRLNRSPRFVFIGFSVVSKRETETRAIGIGFWALTPVCGPYPAAIVSSPRDRSCHGLCLLQGCGHIEVHSDGLDPARIAKPQGP